MKMCVRRADRVLAQKVDFTSWNELKALYEFLDRRDWAIYHQIGDRFPNLICEGYRYDQGDYMLKSCKNGKIYRYLGNDFEADWEEI